MHGGMEQYFLSKLLSGLAHFGKDAFDSCGCCLDVYTFSVINRNRCPWLRECSALAKAGARCKSCAHFNFCYGKKRRESGRRQQADARIWKHQWKTSSSTWVFAWCKITFAFTSWGIEIDLFFAFSTMTWYPTEKKKNHNPPWYESSAMTQCLTRPLHCNIWPLYQSSYASPSIAELNLNPELRSWQHFVLSCIMRSSSVTECIRCTTVVWVADGTKHLSWRRSNQATSWWMQKHAAVLTGAARASDNYLRVQHQEPSISHYT